MASVINRGTKTEPAWYAKFKDADGKHKRVHTHQTTKEGAKRFAAELEARVARGLVGMPEPPKPEERAARVLTVADLVEEFLAKYTRPKIVNIEHYRAHMRTVAKHQILPYPIASMPVVAVEKLHVERWRDSLVEAKYAANTVNLAIQLLRTIFNWAADQQRITCLNPCRKVEPMPSRPSEEHYSMDEVHKLLALPEAPPPSWSAVYVGEQAAAAWRCVRMMIWTALYTGMRKGELLGLRWERLRLDSEIPRLEVKKSYDGPTKNRKPRTLPIHPELLPELRAWRDQCPETPEGLVFPVARRDRLRHVLGWRMGRRKDMCGVVEALQEAGCHVPALESAHKATQEKAWHAMRHSFATHFLEASGNGDAQSKLLGHSQDRGTGGQADVSAGYTHTGLAYLARELAKMTLTPPTAAGITNLQQRQRQRAASK